MQWRGRQTVKGMGSGRRNSWLLVLWTAINAGIIVEMVSVNSFFVIFPPPPSSLMWRVLKRAEISLFRWDCAHISIWWWWWDSEYFLGWRQAFLIWTKTRAGAEEMRNGLCYFGPPDPSSVLPHSALSPEKLTYMNCSLYMLTFWIVIAFGKWNKLGRRLKEDNTAKIHIPLEPSSQVALQVGCLLLPKTSAHADSSRPYNSPS